MSGPLNAGAFGPNKLDPTFGPEAVFVKAPPAPNSPGVGSSSSARSPSTDVPKQLTVTLRDVEGAGDLQPRCWSPQQR